MKKLSLVDSKIVKLLEELGYKKVAKDVKDGRFTVWQTLDRMLNKPFFGVYGERKTLLERAAKVYYQYRQD